MNARTLLCLLVAPSLALAGCASEDSETQSEGGEAEVPAAFDPLSISIFVFGRSDLDVWDEEVIYDAQRPATGPGFVVNQKVDVYTHVFDGFQPPEGWSFIVGEPVPTPP